MNSTVPTTMQSSSAIMNTMKADLMRAKAEAEQANAWRKECADVCAVLTLRLQELAGFLDSLLKHKDVLSVLAQDRHKAMRKAVDSSLDLSRSLNNMSISGGPGRFSFDENNLMQFSSVSELLNSSRFNVSFQLENSKFSNTGVELTQNVLIENLKTENLELKAQLERLSAESALSSDMMSTLKARSMDRGTKTATTMRLEAHSESEAWSEPDRQVSHERIGLDDSVKMNARSFGNKYDASSSGSEVTGANTSTQLTRKNSALRLQEKIGQLETELSATVEQNERLKQSLIDTENSLVAEKKAGKAFMDEIDTIRQDNERLAEKKRKLSERCVEMQNKLDDQIEKYKLMQMACDEKIQEIQSLQQNYATQIDVMLSQENVKLELMRQQLTDSFNKQMEEQENKYEQSLQRDWVSRVMHEEEMKKLHDAEERLGDAHDLLKLMRENEDEIKAQLTEKEAELRTLKRSLDESTLQTSKAVLERTKVMNERDQLEQQMRELQDKYHSLSTEKADLYTRHANLSAYTSKMHNRLIENEETQFQLSRSASQGNARYMLCTTGTGSGGEQSGYTSDELKQRLDNSSPDLGIESDATARSSSTDANTIINSRSEFKISPASALLEGDEEDSKFGCTQQPLILFTIVALYISRSL